MYKTDRLILSPLTVKDTYDENYLDWFNDQEVTKYNSHGLFPKNEKELNEFRESLSKGNLILKIICDTLWIGNVSLQSFDWINRSCEFAVVIGNKDFWHKGICTEAAKVLFYHAFKKLNIRRIWSGTNSKNIGMENVFKKLGMSYEGCFRDAAYINGEYTDVVEYGILCNEFDCNKAKELFI